MYDVFRNSLVSWREGGDARQAQEAPAKALPSNRRAKRFIFKSPVNSKTKIDVAICTRGDSDILSQTLQSVRVQRFSHQPKPDLRVVVVLNHATKKTEDLTPFLTHLDGIRLTIVLERREGIPFARNAALDALEPDTRYIAFIDDDETAHENWLEVLLGEAETSGADAVEGCVEVAFDDETAAPEKRSPLFDGLRHEVRGPLSVAATGNVMLRTAFIRQTQIRFPESFAKSGGSDTSFFHEWRRLGGTIRSAPEAWVRHHFSKDRLNQRWMAHRSMRLGNCRVLARLRDQGRLKTSMVTVPKVGWNLVTGLGLVLIGHLTGPRLLWTGRHRIRVGCGQGLALLGFEREGSGNQRRTLR